MFTRLNEGARNAEFIVYEVDPRFTRTVVEVTAPADAPVEPGTVLRDEANGDAFIGVTIYRVNRGQTKKIAVVSDGPTILNENLLTFPVIVGDAPATAALKDLLIEDAATRGIKIRPEGGTEINL